MSNPPRSIAGQDRYRHAFRAALMGALLAVIGNFLWWQIGLRLLGVPYMIRPGPPGTELAPLGAANIILFSALPAFLAAALLRWLGQRSPNPGRTFIRISEVVLVLSFLPVILMPVELMTRASLMLMHVITTLAITDSLLRWGKE